MKNIIIFTLVFVTVCFGLKAQKPEGMGQQEKTGELKGVIIDQTSEQALAFANVVLYKQRDSVMVDGTITNEKGAFVFSKLPFGRFYLMVQFVGYPPYKVDSIFIRPNAPSVDLGNIQIKVQSVSLEEVVIKGQKAALEFNLDRKVINIDQNIAATSSTAAEIMQTIPSVSVDIDGNVSLRGSSNVIILIDGRPSMLSSLDQLPASMVESVELITNPSAKYDPDGTSGMINIILKKKQEPGYNGMISLNAGTGNKANASVNFNYRHNKINVFLDASGRLFQMNGYSFLDRETTFGDTLFNLLQNQNFTNQGMFGNLRGGFDYFINKKNTISFSANFNERTFNNNQENDYKNYRETAGIQSLYNYFKQHTQNANNGKGLEYGLNYKKTFDKKIQELTVDLFYSQSGWDTESDLIKKFYDNNLEPSSTNDFLQQVVSLSDRTNINAQLDYVQPIGNGGRMETGYKFTYRDSDADYNMFHYDYDTLLWLNDTVASNRFLYDEQIHSGYFIYSNTIKDKFKYQGGVRVEQAFLHGNQITSSEEFKRDTLNIFPSLHLKYDYSQNHSFILSYSRRVNRPSGRVLNPFVNYADPIYLSKGNSYLNPEFINSYETAYSFMKNKTAINTTVFYRNTEGIVSRIMTIENNSTTSMTTYENLNSEESYGVELIVSQDVLKWWKINANYSHYRTQVYGQNINTEENDNISWTLKLNSSMKFPKDFEVQSSFNYSSPQIFTGGMSNYRFFNDAGGLGKQSANYFFDISMKKSVLKGKGNITLRVSDVFKTIKFDVETSGNNFVSHMERRRDSRVLFVGFSYRINEYRRPKIKKPADSGLEEME